MHYFDASFDYMQLKQHLDQEGTYKYSYGINFWRENIWHYLFLHPTPPGGAKKLSCISTVGLKLNQ
jgi:hypothetical protein